MLLLVTAKTIIAAEKYYFPNKPCLKLHDVINNIYIGVIFLKYAKLILLLIFSI